MNCDGAPYIEERHSSYLDPADDEETELVKLDTIKKILVWMATIYFELIQ